MLHCWLLALTKSQGTAHILRPDKFTVTNPVGRDGKGEAGRVSCFCSALGRGVSAGAGLLTGAAAGASLYAYGTETKSTANPLLQHLCFMKADLISDLSTFITRNL